MTFDIVFSYGVRILIVSIVAVLALLAMRKASASFKNVFAVYSLFMLMALPFVGTYAPDQTVELPKNIALPIQYVESPQTAVAENARESWAPARVKENAIDVVNLACFAAVCIWMLGTILLLVRLVCGAFRVASWRQGATLLRPGVYVSDQVEVPLTTWIKGPVIFLPMEALHWPGDRLARVLAHERSHIHRNDLLWNVLGSIACAAYWPIPTVWILQRMARETSEKACDDRVLKLGVVASDYAQDICDVARTLPRRFPMPVLPMANSSEVKKRVKHILDRRARRSSASLWSSITTAFAFAMIALPVTVLGVAAVRDIHPPRKAKKNGKPPYKMGTPGNAKNNFIAVLPDKRKVQLAQIQIFEGDELIAWKPDGTFIKNPSGFGQERLMKKFNTGIIVYKYLNGARSATGRKEDFNFRSKEHLIGMTEPSETFYDFKLKEKFTIRRNKNGTFSSKSKEITDLEVLPHQDVMVPVLDEDGYGIKQKDGTNARKRSEACTVKFTLRRKFSTGNFWNTAYDKLGKRYGIHSGQQSRWVGYQTFKWDTTYAMPLDKLDHVDISTMEFMAVEFQNVHYAPPH